MSKKRTITLSIIGICLIITLMIGISYSLWTIKASQENPNNVLADCFNITFTENNNILLDNTFPMYDEDGKKLEPYTFTIKNNCASYADYQVQLEITNSSTLDEQYLKIMLNENTPSLMNTLEVGEPQETNMKKAYILTKSSLDKNAEKTYNLRIWLDENVTTETEGVQNSTWSAKVTVTASYRNTEPPFCEMNPETGACEILAKGETAELKFDNTVDNNLRYVGADPNNYVSFNNELWRIIGVMNNIDDGTGKKEPRLKIIRNESIGEYSWDSKGTGGINDWSTSTLQVMLNSDELSLTEEAKTLIGNTLWHLGGSSTNDDVTTSMFYERERGTDVYIDHATEWIGKVGLLYASDYGYATSGGVTTSREACLNKELYNWDSVNDCYKNDWLYDNTNWQWTLTILSASSIDAFSIRTKGYLRSGSTYNAGYGYNIFPTLYLSSNVKISGGDGTEENPFILMI